MLLAGAAIGLGLAALVVVGAARRGAQRDALLAEARALGAESFAPALLRAAGREVDPLRVGADAARALLVGELDRTRLRRLSAAELAAEPARSRERLAWIEARASEWLRQRPGSFEGPYLLGGAALARGLATGRLDRELVHWEPALRLAVERAPRDLRPLRLLVAAYLEAWSVLPHATRRQVDGLVARAFEHPEVLRALLDRWLFVRGHDPAALAVVPDEIPAWREVRRALAASGDAVAWLRAEEHLRLLEQRAAAAALARGAAALEAGRASVARQELITVLPLAPRDRSGAALVAEALSAMPAGAPSSELQEAAAGWLEWALDLAQVGRNPLPGRVVARLDAALPEAPPALRARALLAAGDLAGAERLERRAAATADPAWDPFFLELAAVLLARNEPEDAARVFTRASPDARGSAPGRRLATALGGRLADAASPALAPAASRWPEERSAGRLAWPAPAWRYRAGVAWTVIDAGEGLAELELVVYEVAPGGSVVELAVNDESWRQLAAGRPGPAHGGSGADDGVRLRFAQPLAAGLHLLRLRTLHGGTVRAGELSARPLARR
jgi:hypothetical protein